MAVSNNTACIMRHLCSIQSPSCWFIASLCDGYLQCIAHYKTMCIAQISELYEYISPIFRYFSKNVSNTKKGLIMIWTYLAWHQYIFRLGVILEWLTFWMHMCKLNKCRHHHPLQLCLQTLPQKNETVFNATNLFRLKALTCLHFS